MDTQKHQFSIDSATPDKLHMSKLGEYLVTLGSLFGEKENVRFECTNTYWTNTVQDVKDATVFMMIHVILNLTTTRPAPMAV